jgi:hypothetical protein
MAPEKGRRNNLSQKIKTIKQELEAHRLELAEIRAFGGAKELVAALQKLDGALQKLGGA